MRYSRRGATILNKGNQAIDPHSALDASVEAQEYAMDLKDNTLKQAFWYQVADKFDYKARLLRCKEIVQ